jgi:hypothetical protein
MMKSKYDEKHRLDLCYCRHESYAAWIDRLFLLFLFTAWLMLHIDWFGVSVFLVLDGI